MKFLRRLNKIKKSDHSNSEKINEFVFPSNKSKTIILFASIAINLLALAFPLLMLQLYDRILPHQSLDTLGLFSAGVCGAVVLETITRIMRSYITAWVSAKFENKVMNDLAARVLTAPLSEIERQGIGVIAQNFKSISTLKNQYSGNIFQQLIDLSFAILYLLVIYVFSLWIGLLLTTGYVLFVVIIWSFSTKNAILIKKQKVADLRRNHFLKENITNIHLLKSMSMEPLRLRRYEKLQEKCAELIAKNSYAIEMSVGMGSVFSALMTTLVISLGAWLVIAHKLTNGELAACVLLGMRSLSPLQSLGGIWSKYLQDQVTADKLTKLFPNSKKMSKYSSAFENDCTAFGDRATSLELIDVSFQYPGTKHPIFQNINLTIGAGECVALSGGSNSGRSTLLRIMAGLLPTTTGHIKLNDQELSKNNDAILPCKMAYLSQDGQLFEGSILDNMTGFEAQRLERALHIASELGLSDYVSRLPRGWDTPVGDMATESLPWGYRQRISIVRAFSGEPNVVLIDDAAASLDSEGDTLFLRLLATVKNKVTLVMVSNNEAYLRLADRYIQLRDGRLIELEPTQENLPSLNRQFPNAEHINSISSGLNADTPRINQWQRPLASEFFQDIVDDNSLDSGKLARIHRAIDSKFKKSTDLSICLCVLLVQLNIAVTARDVLEALPDSTDQLDLPKFQNIMAQLGYKAEMNRCRLNGIPSQSMPCLFLPDTGPAFVVIGLQGKKIRISTNTVDEFQVVDNLNISGQIFFYEPAITSVNDGQSWVGKTVIRFLPLVAQAVLSALIASLILMMGPLFTMASYSTIIPSGAVDTLFYLALGSVLSLGSAYFFIRQKVAIISYISGRIEYLFGTAILQKIFSMPPALTERVSVGAQLSRLQSFEAIRDIFLNQLGSTLLELPASITLLIALSLINSAALLIFISMTAVYLILYWLFFIPTRTCITNLGQALSKQNQFLVEMLSKMRTIRECHAELLWLERFKEISAQVSIASFNAERLSSTLVGLSYFIMMSSALLIVIITTPLVFAQVVTSGALIASMMLMWRVLSPAQTFFTNMSRLEKIRSSARQIDNLMQIQGEQKIATAPLSKRRIGQIEFARVSFRYSMNSDPAAIGLDFKISSGEMIAISGSNGSGKSTVLRLILGMYQPQAGAILIDGVDIRQIAPAQLRQMIGYVSQEMQFFKMSIIQNLYLAKPDATETEIYQALDLADALAQVLALPGGLNYRAGENLAELSTSLRQKISLARCYLTKAPILLFDEPALGLGEIGERKFEEILKDLKGKRTVVINTQKMSQILLADTLIVLDKGYLKAAGAPSELLKNPVASK